MQQHSQTIERISFSGTPEQVQTNIRSLTSLSYRLVSLLCIASDGRGNELYQAVMERIVARKSPEEWLQQTK